MAGRSWVRMLGQVFLRAHSHVSLLALTTARSETPVYRRHLSRWTSIKGPMLPSDTVNPNCIYRCISSEIPREPIPGQLEKETIPQSTADGFITSTEPDEESSSSLELEIQGVPRRKQRFLLQKALKMKPVDDDRGPPGRKGFTTKVIDVNRTCKVTKGGKVLSFAALVICGNKNGVVGFGRGKSSEVGPAIDKATRKSLRNLHYFQRSQGDTIFHGHVCKFEKTKIYLWPAKAGSGMRASSTVGGILKLAGFKNVKSKVIGSRHPLNTVKAVFKALSEIESPEEAEERQGRALMESRSRVADQV